MAVIKLFRLSVVAITQVILVFAFASSNAAQVKTFKPDLSVAGLKLGDRASAKAFLTGYQPRSGADGVPEYLFYNAQATTVMKLTAASFDDLYFITEIEVFSVGESYKNRHFQLEKIGHFVTESGVFIGFRQSGSGLAIALVSGIPNLARNNMVGPKDLVNKKGEPTTRTKIEEKETLDYKLDSVDVAGEPDAKYRYAAQYYFSKNKLKRFSMKLLAK